MNLYFYNIKRHNAWVLRTKHLLCLLIINIQIETTNTKKQCKYKQQNQFQKSNKNAKAIEKF